MSNNSELIFKDYNVNQILLFPPSLEELIDAHHPVRVVNQVVDCINIEPLLAKYKPGGTSVYHPRMLLKVLIYSYLTNIYSSRKIEAALKENIHFMWLSAMSKPDHNTIARFRSDRLKDVLQGIFTQVVELLIEEGLVNIKNIYTDGTKIESVANKYTFVWGKAIKTSKERISKQLEELWNYTQKVASQELNDDTEVDFQQIDREKVEQTISKIDKALKGKKVAKKVKQKLNYAKKNWPDKLNEYQQKEAILGNRNSYSKTDLDATFMRMKEDHMLNGQLKPAYNWQISTSDQYIVNYSIHANPTDTLTLKPHFDQFKEHYNRLPENICADAGYGSQENYQFIEDNQLGNYVKFNYFHKEQTKKWKNDPFKSSNLYYNKKQDKVYCPMGQPMDRLNSYKRKTKSGFEQHITRYQARSCEQCPLRSSCFKAKGNRIIELNHQLREYKQKVRENLLSDQGIVHRKKRPCDVEAVFGNIKGNKNFRRFMLKGNKKVLIETGLLAIAHNLAKKAA